MPILRAEMAWSVPINIFSIDVCLVLDKGLYNTKIASQTRYMEWCSKIVCPRVNLSLELNKDLNHWCVPLTSCQMEWSKAIRVSAVDNLKHLVVLIELLFCITENFVNFIGITLIDFCPVVHFHFLDVLFSLLLLR